MAYSNAFLFTLSLFYYLTPCGRLFLYIYCIKLAVCRQLVKFLQFSVVFCMSEPGWSWIQYYLMDTPTYRIIELLDLLLSTYIPLLAQVNL